MFLLLSGVKSSVLNTETLADFEVRSEKCGIVLAQWKCASLERQSHSAQEKATGHTKICHVPSTSVDTTLS